jgi:pyruvate/2-oxoglutarate dehydrogenase complex dihydrolipoamide acyltransferase (E2) component
MLAANARMPCMPGTKTLSAISAEIKDLSTRARVRQLKPQEYIIDEVVVRRG